MEEIIRIKKRLKLRFITHLERLNLNFELGKYIDEGYDFKYSQRAKKGARRLYYAYKDRKEDLIWEKNSARDLGLMNETNYQLFLSGLTEFSRGNVLTIDHFDDNNDIITFDSTNNNNQEITFDFDTASHIEDLAPPYDQVTRITTEPSGVVRNSPDSSELDRNRPETYGVPRNVPELLDEPIVLDL